MKVLIIGSGGREHAIAKKFYNSKKVEQIWVSPGNPGMLNYAKIVNINSFNDIIDFVSKNNIDFVFVGPEQPLSEGIVDKLNEYNIKVIGPTQNAARIESSKIFSKNIMKKYNIPTAEFETFDDYYSAVSYLKNCSYPKVIKADGLAAGKGVVIVNNYEEAKQVVYDMMNNKKYDEAGINVVVEEFMQGWETSIFAFCDGDNYCSTIFSQDHKPIFDGDKGPNTGGMGAYAPVDKADKYKKDVENKIISPILNALKKENSTYKGVLYVGLMITKDGPKVVEFNCRFGDPETEVVLELLETDLFDICDAIINKKINKIDLEWKKSYAITVVLASKGYPGNYEKNKAVTYHSNEEIEVFFAGVKSENDRLFTSGGRVMMVTAVDKNLKDARNKAYSSIKNINFDGMCYRSDIGDKGL